MGVGGQGHRAAATPDELTVEEQADFEELLNYVKQNRGFDFTGYKRSGLMRRVGVRMSAVGVESYSSYLDVLQVDADEVAELFDTILINVTSFFRDAPAWEHLASEVVPKMLAEKPPGTPIRAWSAGCASGEEAYSLAMMLAERIGPEETLARVKIYGTDIDDDALNVARHGVYSGKELAGVPDEMRARYFEPFGSKYAFRKDLRRTVIFGRHDLVHAVPISHIDILACRNTLMYFTPETQAKVLARLHFALEETGVLFLGKAEMLLAHADLFRPIDLRRRIFGKVSTMSRRDWREMITDSGAGEAALEDAGNYRQIREAAADAGLMPHIAVHVDGTLVMANAAARSLFGLQPADVGRPLRDLEMSYRPAELRSVIDQVVSDRKTKISRVRWTDAPEESQAFDITITPLLDRSGAIFGVSVTFTDVTALDRLEAELQHSNRELQTVYEEFQSTNEELETTNEELQSTIEELETTNEELQSTNEELETMNAELQSTNEEMQTINDELRRRTEEIDELNEFLEAMLGSQRGGLVVVDPDMRVTVWNAGSAELWGLRSDEVPGRHFLNLDIGLPVEELRGSLRAILSRESDYERVEVAATNRRGRDFTCRVSVAPLAGKDGGVRGAILIMEDAATA